MTSSLSILSDNEYVELTYFSEDICILVVISIIFSMDLHHIRLLYWYAEYRCWWPLAWSSELVISFLVHLNQRSWELLPSLHISSFFSETTGPIGTKLSRNVPWMVLYKVSVFRSSRIFNMTAMANNMLWLAEISKIFFSETNELTEPKL